MASVDLSLVRKTIGEISRRASLAIRFLALFALAMGVPVLFSAVAATRRERVREGVLLKTLGATRAQIGRILVSEYTVLGALGSLTGLVLSFGGAWAIMTYVFDRPFTAATTQALVIAAAMVLMAVGDRNAQRPRRLQGNRDGGTQRRTRRREDEKTRRREACASRLLVFSSSDY